MFGLTTRGQLDSVTQLEFERLYARLSEFLSVSFTEDGTLITADDTSRVVGEVVDYGGSTPPEKWLICDGSQKSRVTFKSLFEVIGTLYGAGDGSTTFNIPDTRGRFTLGKAASSTGSVLGETGGAIDHVHTVGAHTHSVSGTTSANGGHDHSGTTSASGTGNTSVENTTIQVANGTDFFVAANGHVHSGPSHTHTVSVNNVSDHTHTFSATTGASSAVDTGTSNPPFVVFNKIIYTGVIE